MYPATVCCRQLVFICTVCCCSMLRLYAAAVCYNCVLLLLLVFICNASNILPLFLIGWIPARDPELTAQVPPYASTIH
eukprot:572239-Rhodomonas_salina.2